MSNPLHAKIADAVHQEIVQVLTPLGHFLAADDPQIVAWMDALEKALPAGRASAFLRMADVMHLTGNIDQVDRFITRAETNGIDPWLGRSHRAAMYQNLGLFSRAQSEARLVFSVQYQNVGMGLPHAVGNGGFGFARELLEQARVAQIPLDQVDQLDEIERIADGTRDLGVPDEAFARVLDIAGDLMRERGLLWLDRAPRFSFDEEMGCPGIRYRLEVTPEEAAEMDAEFIDRVVAADLDRLPLTVGFVGTVESTSTAEA
ncbi:hypothetical protein NWF24_17770 [Variovorax paradoxus]|uniref:hypothetical protein n=1 Tax=Variovorax paradoxus TaxID=34073 RepID=UPI0021ABC716|nr:hypothetical protein [Variovorax paradoxus]UVH54695.1 hypothetical protein NWF24_17770 [Variovorax paradoxus]